MNVFEVIKYELKYILYSRQNLSLLWGLPIVFAVIFGLIYQSDVLRAVPIVIYDQDNSSLSRSLVSSFEDSERFMIVGNVNSEEESNEYLNSEEAIAALIIPYDFSKKIKLGQGSRVELAINSVNVIYPNTIIAAGKEIITAYNIKLGQKLVESIESDYSALAIVAPILIRERILNNPTSSYRYFFLPGIVTNGIQLAIILATCTAMLREYKNNEILAKGTSCNLVVGKCVAYWLVAMLAISSAMLICIKVWNIPLKGSFISLLLIYGAFIFVITNLGLFFSAFISTPKQPLNPFVLTYVIPSFLFSGYNWPDIAKNNLAQIYSLCLPMTYSVNVIRDIFLAGYSPDLYVNCGILLLIGITLCIITIIAHKRKIKSA